MGVQSPSTHMSEVDPKHWCMQTLSTLNTDVGYLRPESAFNH